MSVDGYRLDVVAWLKRPISGTVWAVVLGFVVGFLSSIPRALIAGDFSSQLALIVQVRLQPGYNSPPGMPQRKGTASFEAWLGRVYNPNLISKEIFYYGLPKPFSKDHSKASSVDWKEVEDRIGSVSREEMVWVMYHLAAQRPGLTVELECGAGGLSEAKVTDPYGQGWTATLPDLKEYSEYDLEPLIYAKRPPGSEFVFDRGFLDSRHLHSNRLHWVLFGSTHSSYDRANLRENLAVGAIAAVASAALFWLFRWRHGFARMTGRAIGSTREAAKSIDDYMSKE